VLWENSHAVLRENSHAEGNSPYSTMIIKNKEATAQGGNILGDKIIPAIQWLEKCGVKVSKQKTCILFKSVKTDYTTRNNVSFKPRTLHEALDWDADFKGECGAGIHYCPTVAQARKFRDDGVYIACKINVNDLAALPAFAEYPDKIRGKGGYSLYEVDENGAKKVKVA
jgi:hypothetical protein